MAKTVEKDNNNKLRLEIFNGEYLSATLMDGTSINGYFRIMGDTVTVGGRTLVYTDFDSISFYLNERQYENCHEYRESLPTRQQ